MFFVVDHPEDHDPIGGRSLRDVILGANDGFVSILGLVTGVAGGTSNASTVVLAGVAGAIAAALSMGLGNYISVKSQREVFRAKREREIREIETIPEIERAEVRRIYARKGFKGKELDLVVRRLTADKALWLDVMMKEELNIHEEDFQNPWLNAFLTGFAFALASVFPILPYLLFPLNTAVSYSVILTLSAVFCVGAAKTVFTNRSPLTSGAEMALIAAFSAGLAFLVGNLIGSAL